MPNTNSSSVYLGKRNRGSLAADTQALERSLALVESINPLAYGSKGQQNSRALARDTWNDFVEHTLKKDPSQPPREKDLLLFIASIPDQSEGRQKIDGSTAMSVTYLKNWLQCVLVHLEVKHNWKPPASAVHGLKALLYKMEENGLISRAPTRDKQWVSARLIKSMTCVLFQDALLQGTTSWDLTVAKALSMSIQCATGARAGDLVKANGYDDETVTKLKDFVIKVVQGSEGLYFRAMLTLRFTKEHKHDPSRNHVIAIDSSLKSTNNTADPIKLALILGLRTGALRAASIDELVKTALARPDRKIQWAQPEWPLHPVFEPNASTIIPDVSTTGSQLGHTLNEAAEKCSLEVHLIPHDIRRGAARDMARLPSDRLGGETAARKLLNHSHSSMFAGVTREYIGEATQSRWEERMMLPVDAEWDLEAPSRNTKRTRVETETQSSTSSPFMDGFRDFEGLDSRSDADLDVDLDLLHPVEAPVDDRLDVLDLSPIEFIDKFSRINTSTAYMTRQAASRLNGKPNKTDIGNTRDPSTPFPRRCPHFADCHKEFDTQIELERHQVTCTPANTVKTAGRNNK